MIIYIAGPYRSKYGKLGIIRNIWKARQVAKELWKMGHTPICPHLNSALLDGIVPDQRFLDGDIEILKRCDAIVLMPGWRKSEGARKEFDIAFEELAAHKIFFWKCEQRVLRELGAEGGSTNG
jgi:hypothetical protein